MMSAISAARKRGGTYSAAIACIRWVFVCLLYEPNLRQDECLQGNLNFLGGGGWGVGLYVGFSSL